MKRRIFIILPILIGLTFAARIKSADTHPWPPVLGKSYPDLELVDQTGKKTRLSDLKGKVILLEPVGMNCPACQSFAGAGKKGAFKNITPQHGLESIESYFKSYAGGADFNDTGLVHVQLLLYGISMEVPTAADARAWAAHFGLDRSKNKIVLAGTKALQNRASYDLIPGFQLIDKNFILRSDSTGHHPKENLWETLLPMVGRLLGEVGGMK